MRHLNAALLALVLCLGLALSTGHDPTPTPTPQPSTGAGRQTWSPATPAETLAHQLHDAWLMDEIAAGRQ